ncbi:EAL domain-containing protein [Clostridium sp. 19966]|uniref:ABC transporter substrate binding protein n=1 Tax=Clostridium sp. 19966 TaxID=2768166 RepID=UPI0028DFB359|nr:ABC transporter substrate binding protein [Clostridium sp. 19966]MDT8717243.1 EAL domain-containing protein [Clostridium sp. 19966]
MNRLKRIHRIIICIIIIISSFHYSVKALGDSSLKPNVLILNSYNSGLLWTNEEVNGILSKIQNSSRLPQIYTEYMDWKSFGTQENLNLLYKDFQYKYSSKKIDLIICTDDKAVDFAIENRAALFSNASIVFCGLNNLDKKIDLSKVNNITGSNEVIFPSENIKLALKLNPALKNVYFIYDNSADGIAIANSAIADIKKNYKNLSLFSLNNLSISDMLDKVKTIDKDSVILLCSYSNDSEGSKINYNYFYDKLSNNSPVPILSLYTYALNHGMTGGVMVDGYLHGREAGNLALKIINGQNIDSLPIKSTNAVKTLLDYNQLKKLNIDLSSVPSNVEIVNKPFSFIETYKNIVILTFTILAMLILFIALLLAHIRKINRLKKELVDNNEELTYLYEEAAAADDELKANYVNLSKAQEELEYSAYHDALTGLFNKLKFYDHISSHIKLLNASSSMEALLYIDIDNFKIANDALGHLSGDKLLFQISQRLNLFSDENSSLYRIDGDEFVFYLKNVISKDEVSQFASKIIESFKQSFKVENNVMSFSSSIGIAMFPFDGDNIEALLKCADMAMYKVKTNGRNSYMFYNSSINDEVQNKFNIQKHLQKALDNEEFIIYYQPQINLKDNAIDGFEALIRWNSPELGFVSPIKFISIAEDSGFIIPLGKWILKKSCEFIKALNMSRASSYKIAVNISVMQLLQDDFVDVINSVLKETGLEPSYLELEITESIIMESIDLIEDKLEYLKFMGITIAMDDFGTGYSSLASLRKLPLTTLKIDKLFIDDISLSSNTNMTDTIIALGHRMGLKIVAEGVENQFQLDYLKENNCDIIQGYLFYKPLPPSELEQIV